MFFSWCARNKHFKSRSNLSGQIFPILLICLVGLVVAVGITITIGENAKLKTCASNAADAGSLAAASYWAAAFNKLVDRNNNNKNTAGDNFGQYMSKNDTYQYYKRMAFYYTEMRNKYKILYDSAKTYLAEALTHSQAAEGLASSAFALIRQPGANCTIWTNQRTAANFNKQAAAQALEAAKCIGAFNILTQYMKDLTDFFKNNQTQNYCEGQDFMDKAYDTSRKNGLSYAFSNSCTQSRVGNALGDDFNFWLATGKHYDPPSNKATYEWPVATTAQCGTSKCGITVTLDLPKILSYELKHTNWNYPQKKTLNVVDIPCISNASLIVPNDPFNIAASKSLREDMRKVYALLKDNAVTGEDIYSETKAGYDCCHSCGCYTSGVRCNGYCYSGPKHLRCDPKPHYAAASKMQNELIKKQDCVVRWLHAINTLSGNNLTLPTLKQGNIDIFNNVWSDPNSALLKAVTDCAGVKSFTDVSGYPGMMIININNVTLTPPVWTTTCKVDIFCHNVLTFNNNGTHSCITVNTVSTSTSKFYGDPSGQGENIGKFFDNYYPEIKSAN